ncbi:peptidoglycan-binding domain-containing protein [Streptomyces sp. NPDC051180]|uniref:peptidoglycan-binding domain-containing protein n=1 Tax=unclassified Streptomyces TaxID=2593676 RepID=UPI003450F048
MFKKLTSQAALVAAAAALLTGTVTGGSASASTGASYIGNGYPNGTTAVRCVQHLINYAIDRGRYWGVAKVAEDGIWGPKTRQAVIDVQRGTGGSLSVDGIVGPRTGDMLMFEGDPEWSGGGAGKGPCYSYVPTTY